MANFKYTGLKTKANGKVDLHMEMCLHGNGPYDFESLQNNVEAVLVPSKTYEGVRPAKNGGVTLKFYENPDTAYSDVQAGNLDVLDQVPPSALTTYKDDNSIQAFSEPGSPNSTIHLLGAGSRPSGPRSGNVGVTGRYGRPSPRARASSRKSTGWISSAPTTATGTIGTPMRRTSLM